jgi:hypothetical protein
VNEFQRSLIANAAQQTVDGTIAQSRAGGTCPIEALDGLIAWARETLTWAEEARTSLEKEQGR